MDTNKAFEILLTSFFAVKKSVPRTMVISYPTRRPVTHRATTTFIESEIYEYIKNWWTKPKLQPYESHKSLSKIWASHLYVRWPHILHLLIRSRIYRKPLQPNRALQGRRTLKSATLKRNPRYHKIDSRWWTSSEVGRTHFERRYWKFYKQIRNHGLDAWELSRLPNLKSIW